MSDEKDLKERLKGLTYMRDEMNGLIRKLRAELKAIQKEKVTVLPNGCKLIVQNKPKNLIKFNLHFENKGEKV